ncbi:MAG: type I DNA topoisomerase, partial [Lachnospiraceae bacterium]|nr:type I DNA topoisomerase [Lachnospiraceae bacterium]
KSQMGIDVDNDYEPKYITIRGKGDVLSKLRKEVKKADKVYLATDPDHEGEAIAWHLFHTLKLDPKTTSRITFNEITKNAVKKSIKEAREIDLNLVDAQQTRRILDRVVGYRISPVLWEKVKRGLSAGRVQSVALRLICDREEEINAFVPKEYWSLTASILADKEKKPFEAKFYGIGDKKITVESEEEVKKIQKAIEGKPFTVADIKTGERQRKAPLPFTTSTLQQEASKLLNFSTQKTMRLAQQLYEGVEVKGYGTVALISYLRTDSTRISEEADASVRAYIVENYGKEMEAEQIKEASKGKKIQDAHEAIRPTDVTITPAKVKDSLARDLYRLYQLIWKRFVASRMQPAKYETVSVKLDAGQYRFTAAASKLVFDGFMSMYVVEDEENEEKSQAVVAKLTRDSVLKLSDLSGEQHFTQPAPHYNEASLVRTMEELGIGRPSTYAPTITTILARHYVVKENKNLYVTELGEAVNNIMKQAFPTIVDTSFTANMETLLDSIEEGDIQWKTIIRNFYPDLEQAVQDAAKKLENVKIEDEVSDVECEECGRTMVVKYGPHGKFLACPGFPECRNTKQYLEKIGVACPECGKEVVIRKTKKGRKYYGCENNPECSYMSWQKPVK